MYIMVSIITAEVNGNISTYVCSINFGFMSLHVPAGARLVSPVPPVLKHCEHMHTHDPSWQASPASWGINIITHSI